MTLQELLESGTELATLGGLAKPDGAILARTLELRPLADASSRLFRASIGIDAILRLTQLCDSLRRLQTEGAHGIVDYLAITAKRARRRESPTAVHLAFSVAWRPGRPS
jgi:hypothetical protein